MAVWVQLLKVLRVGLLAIGDWLLAIGYWLLAVSPNTPEAHTSAAMYESLCFLCSLCETYVVSDECQHKQHACEDSLSSVPISGG